LSRKINFFKGLIILLSVIIKSPVLSQQYPVQRFTEENGLPNTNVFRIFEDRRGFLWFGTEYGLCRYDGNKFSNILTKDGEPLSGIIGINEITDQEKIVCTYQGTVNLVNHDTVIQQKINSRYELSNCIHSLYSDGKVWIINKSGDLFKIINNEVVRFNIADNTGREIRFRNMIPFKNNEIMFASNSGLYLYRDGKIEPFYHNLISENIFAICSDNEGSIWTGLRDKVVRVWENGKMETYEMGIVPEISDILVDNNERCWIAIPKNGLMLLENGVFQNITSRLKLKNVLINTLHQDKNGNIWIATHGSGLYCVLSTEMLNYKLESTGLKNYINSIIKDKGKIYIASIGTVSIIEKKQLMRLKIHELLPTQYIYFLSIYNGYLYIGTPNVIIRKNISYPFDEMILHSGAVSYHIDKKENKWIGRFGDAGLLNNDQFKKLRNWKSNGRRINCISSNAEGVLYFGTDSGLIVYNGKILKYSYLDTNPSARQINAIFKDSKDNLWIGTNAGAYVLGKNRILHYSIKDGLSGNRCTAFTEDKSGFIWIATMTGLSMFDGFHFEKFDSKSGLCSDAILSLCIDDNENLWVGTINGLSMLSYKKLHSLLSSPHVYITNARSDDHNYYFPSHIRLSPQNRTLHISYTGIEFPKSDKIEYEFRIDPDERSWHSISGNEMELPVLGPGNYILKIRARHSGYDWSPQTASLTIEVIAPIWKRPMFIILAASILLLILYRALRAVILKKEANRQEKINLQNKLIHLKQQALNSAINPHFVFNCLNSIQSYIYSNDKENANKFLVMFSRLIRTNLEHAEDAFINLGKEIERMVLYLNIEQQRFIGKLTYEFKVDPEINTENVFIPNMILQPYIENAVKHGIMPKKSGGKILVHIGCIDPETLIITIEDNGIGYNNRDHKGRSGHHSIGMNLTRERLDILSRIHEKQFSVTVNELMDDSGKVAGTRVELLLTSKTEIEQEVYEMI
jgi:ligand-binding sensor domain-containing protein